MSSSCPRSVLHPRLDAVSKALILPAVSKMKQRYGATFPIFAKVDINGSNAHPFFVYLKEALGGMIFSDVMWVST